MRYGAQPRCVGENNGTIAGRGRRGHDQLRNSASMSYAGIPWLNDAQPAVAPFELGQDIGEGTVTVNARSTPGSTRTPRLRPPELG